MEWWRASACSHVLFDNIAVPRELNDFVVESSACCGTDLVLPEIGAVSRMARIRSRAVTENHEARALRGSLDVPLPSVSTVGCELKGDT